MCSRRIVATGLAIACVMVCAACGGGPRAATADLASIRQPTPDPTLDAVVRDLPRVLAGVPAPSPTATPIPVPTQRSVAVPKPKPVTQVTQVPTARPTSRPIVPTPTKPRP
jgi:hypothetical protein